MNEGLFFGCNKKFLLFLVGPLPILFSPLLLWTVIKWASWPQSKNNFIGFHSSLFGGPPALFWCPIFFRRSGSAVLLFQFLQGNPIFFDFEAATNGKKERKKRTHHDIVLWNRFMLLKESESRGEKISWNHGAKRRGREEKTSFILLLVLRSRFWLYLLLLLFILILQIKTNVKFIVAVLRCKLFGGTTTRWL